MANRETEDSTTLSARFLQARITTLSTTLIKRLENIFAAALDEDTSPSRNRSQGGRANADEPNPPSYTDTAVKQLQLDVESTALIRAAEDLMVLTRSMKELWLFGGLDTLHDGDGDGDGDGARVQNGISAADRKQMEEDEKTVVRGIRAFLDSLSSVHNDGSTAVSGPAVAGSANALGTVAPAAVNTD